MKNKKGFTLNEIIVILVIIAILAAFSIPAMLSYITASQEKLCDVTRMDMVRLYKTSLINKESSASQAGFETFVEENWGSLLQCPTGGVYTFKASQGVDGQIEAEISCSKHGAAHILTVDEITMGTGGHLGYIKGSYSGSVKDVIIPNTLNWTAVLAIYQDVFSGKGLNSVTFENDSEITRIHARAFQDNNLTEISLPDTLKNIDYGAFSGNSLTKITIGSNVVIEGNAFQNNNDFRTVYGKTDGTGGAGTYVYTEGKWQKQT